MKLESVNNQLVSSENFVSTDFTIANSAKAFRILSSGLYSDKYMAVIRELSTNAWDAHVAAGNKDTPFNVQLPSYMNPELVIRDFGTGLSRQDMMTIYNGYFLSTKTESNDFVGALGLGSKSPFCYADSWTVTSYFNGTMTIYNAVISSEGKPSISPMFEGPTDEPNGLEIRMGVQSNHFYEFKNAAERVYQFFEVRPNVTGQQLSFDTYKYVLKNDKVGVVEGYRSETFAIMGGVAYPVEKNHLSDEASDVLSHYGVHLRFNIGDIEMTASREALEYTPRTIDNLNKAIMAAAKDIATLLQEKIDVCETFAEACYEGEKLKATFSSAIVSNLKWKKPGSNGNPRPLISYQFFRVLGTTPKKDKKLIESIFIHEVSKNYAGKGGQLTYTPIDTINYGKLGPNAKIIIDDTKNCRVGRLAERIRTGGGGYGTQCILVRFDSERAKQYFIKLLGIKENVLVPLSTLPKPASYTKSNSYKVYELVAGSGISAKNSWKVAEVDLADDGFYLEMSMFDAVGLRSPSEVVKAARACGLKIDKVYGFRTPIMTKLQKAQKEGSDEVGEWVDVGKHINAYMDRKLAVPKIKKAIDFLDSSETINSTRFDRIIKVGNMVNYQRSPFKKFVKEIQRVCDARVQALYSLRSWLQKNNHVKVNAYSDAAKAVTERYPMLDGFPGGGVWREWGSSVTVTQIADYINMVDRIERIQQKKVKNLTGGVLQGV